MRLWLKDRDMNHKVLIVEDEPLIALDIEGMVESAGLAVAGIATSTDRAIALAPSADIALVDVNLADGATGPSIGRILAEKYGLAVIFMTANPEAVRDGVKGILGVVRKPVLPRTVEQILKYAIGYMTGAYAATPAGMQVFRT
ncbi:MULTISPECIES: response regulator [unclassified Sinorhizobium]|uniref:response regulator n=1 Tax=unclassified Sinorhizobium TaxID=2613772 RepID=UPI003524CF04